MGEWTQGWTPWGRSLVAKRTPGARAGVWLRPDPGRSPGGSVPDAPDRASGRARSWHQPSRVGAVGTHLQHVGLIVSDLERSRRFYGDALGLEEVPSSARTSLRRFRFGADRGSTCSWRPTRPAERVSRIRGGARRSGSRATSRSRSRDLAAACALRRKARWAPGSEARSPRGDGVVEDFLRRPRRYVLELFQWTGEGWSRATRRRANPFAGDFFFFFF